MGGFYAKMKGTRSKGVNVRRKKEKIEGKYEAGKQGGRGEEAQQKGVDGMTC